jgi:hypothetical protein
MQNFAVESFEGRLRDERLNEPLVLKVIEERMTDYSVNRPYTNGVSRDRVSGPR